MSKPEKSETKEPVRIACGVVMPISAIEDCSAAHWAEVLTIIKESLSEVNFDASLVSYSDESGIIQARIVQRLADDPIVVCDVSAKNPNVMFELGLRLAFDRPTVVVKDEKTNYSFDTSPLEHLSYPRDLRYPKIQEFKRELAAKVKATYEKSQSDPHYSVFLKHFGKLTPKTVPTEEAEYSKIVLAELNQLRAQVGSLVNDRRPKSTAQGKETYTAYGDAESFAKLVNDSELAEISPYGWSYKKIGSNQHALVVDRTNIDQFIKLMTLGNKYNINLEPTEAPKG